MFVRKLLVDLFREMLSFSDQKLVLCFSDKIKNFFKISVKGAPRNLKVTDETTDSFKITWTQAPGRVLRYRVTYRPAAGGESKDVTTPANQRRRTLENLTPDTKYEVSVIPEYLSGPGSPLTGTAATEEGRGNMLAIW